MRKERYERSRNIFAFKTSWKQPAGYFDYFEKKNKILFDSSTSWDSGTKTIKGLQDYNILQCNLDLGGVCGFAIRRHETAFLVQPMLIIQHGLHHQPFILL
ncbi:MAG: hypothetical protein V8R50_01530 [Clostridia bacterium]